jgi:hypothetical protein
MLVDVIPEYVFGVVGGGVKDCCSRKLRKRMKKWIFCKPRESHPRQPPGKLPYQPIYYLVLFADLAWGRYGLYSTKRLAKRT